jgi:hypothetical protein
MIIFACHSIISSLCSWYNQRYVRPKWFLLQIIYRYTSPYKLPINIKLEAHLKNHLSRILCWALNDYPIIGLDLTISQVRTKYLDKVCLVCKRKVVPVLNQVPRHEGVLGEWRYISSHSLTLALDGGKWSASRPGRFTSRARVSGTHWIGGLVGPRDVLDMVVKRKIPSPPPPRESKPGTLIV